MLSRLLKKGDHLLAFYTGKALEEVFDGISAGEMIEKAFHGHTSAHEDRLSAENVGVL